MSCSLTRLKKGYKNLLIVIQSRDYTAYLSFEMIDGNTMNDLKNKIRRNKT